MDLQAKEQPDYEKEVENAKKIANEMRSEDFWNLKNGPENQLSSSKSPPLSKSPSFFIEKPVENKVSNTKDEGTVKENDERDGKVEDIEKKEEIVVKRKPWEKKK